MRTRLKRQVDFAPSRIFAGLCKRHDFGVRRPRFAVPSFAYDTSAVHNNAADTRVRRRSINTTASELQGPCHESGISRYRTSYAHVRNRHCRNGSFVGSILRDIFPDRLSPSESTPSSCICLSLLCDATNQARSIFNRE